MIVLSGRKDNKGAALTGIVFAGGVLNSLADARVFIQTDDEMCRLPDPSQVLGRVQLVGDEHSLRARSPVLDVKLLQQSLGFFTCFVLK